jgi:CDP-4-dehydro-6-deoxyglucose reductase
MRLYWGGRRREDLYLEDVVRGFESQLPLTYVPVLSRPRAEDAWTGFTGYVQHAVVQDLPDLSAHQVYACGSPAMVRAASRAFVSEAGLPENEFFGDAFLTAADLTPQA